ncbi:MAG: hypothetical protein M1812_007781 [Candelaria pacifica]|nr:MAG: hypothetical protein M1812_007781 [Candelaria pacifica]
MGIPIDWGTDQEADYKEKYDLARAALSKGYAHKAICDRLCFDLLASSCPRWYKARANFLLFKTGNDPRRRARNALQEADEIELELSIRFETKVTIDELNIFREDVKILMKVLEDSDFTDPEFEAETRRRLAILNSEPSAETPDESIALGAMLELSRPRSSVSEPNGTRDSDNIRHDHPDITSIDESYHSSSS